MQASLRSDALASAGAGVSLRIGMPWMRALPLSSVLELSVALDGQVLQQEEIRLVLGGRRVEPAALGAEDGWWFVQDRIVVEAARTLEPGRFEVAVELRLLIPYLAGGPGQPLVLPFSMAASLELDAAPRAGVFRDVGA